MGRGFEQGRGGWTINDMEGTEGRRFAPCASNCFGPPHIFFDSPFPVFIFFPRSPPPFFPPLVWRPPPPPGRAYCCRLPPVRHGGERLLLPAGLP